MRRSVLVILSLVVFAIPAVAKPSDWADVIEKPGEKSDLPSARNNAPDVVAKANVKAPKKERATKKATPKAKKSPRRGKVKHGRR